MPEKGSYEKVRVKDGTRVGSERSRPKEVKRGIRVKTKATKDNGRQLTPDFYDLPFKVFIC